MQYLLRFILASYVVWFHTGSYYFPSAGKYAVFGFYTLSGFIITKVLNEVYYKKTSPHRDFFINRFWRLYPTFLVAVLFGLLLAFFTPDEAKYWNPVIRMPEGWNDAVDALSNITIIGLHHGIPGASSIRFAPPSWSTAIEIYFYIFLFIIGARSMRTALIWTGLSAASVLAIILYLTLDPEPRFAPGELIYSSVFGVSFCFAIGALTYFLSEKKLSPRPYLGLIAYVLAVIVPLIPWKYLVTPPLIQQLLLYTESLLIAIFLLYEGNRQLGRWSIHLGDISYPLFLIHWQIAILLTALGAGTIKSDAVSMVIIYGVSVAIAFAMVQLVETPLKRVRAKVRQRA